MEPQYPGTNLQYEDQEILMIFLINLTCVGVASINLVWSWSLCLGKSGKGVAILQGFYLPVTEYTCALRINVKSILTYLLKAANLDNITI